ncbi:MAG: hypothetical protein JWP72_1524 [Massilia sp.]|nr:hypothetical protein [Massilia sp.]MDB5790380.1 hypothetical protein [Massilia sp.]
MSTMTFDVAGIAGVREVSPVKQALLQHRVPRQNPVPEAAAAPAKARRTRTFFGLGSAVSFECDNWMRWTGV